MQKDKYSIRCIQNNFFVIDNEKNEIAYIGNSFEECQNMILSGEIEQLQEMCKLYCD